MTYLFDSRFLHGRIDTLRAKRIFFDLTMGTSETIILSLGGSLIVPKDIDTQFLTDFNLFIRKQIAEKNRRFFIICGGGWTTRHYQQAAVSVVGDGLPDEDKDWLGIHSTRLNAHLVRTIFRDIANPVIIEHYDRQYQIADSRVVVCSGWKPGWSTDYCAVMVARNYQSKTVINMSNIDKVYDKDPKKYPDAKPLDKITWDYFAGLVGDTWTPGLNTPFDPIATQGAKELGLHVIILNGKNIANLEAAIDHTPFTGTLIAPQ